MPPATAQPGFGDLTLPAPGSRTARRALGRYFRAVLHDFVNLPAALVPARERRLHGEVARLLVTLAGCDPGRALRAVRLPTVTALIETLRHGAGPARADRLREACALILLELAAHGDVPGSGVVLEPAPDGTFPVLRSPTANLELRLQPGQATALHLRPGAVGVAAGSTPISWIPLDEATGGPRPDLGLRRPYQALAPGVWLAETDNNPLAGAEAHPDKSGNALDLGTQPIAAWLAALRAALDLVATHLAAVDADLRIAVKLVVPVGFHAEQHLSASYREAVGLVYLSLHPQPMTLAEALIHESQHNKLNAVLRFDPLLRDGFDTLVASPVRPDLRPLHGVLLAVHAFLPVAALYEAMLAADHPLSRDIAWRKRFLDVISVNRRGTATLVEHARPTAAGAGLLDEICRLQAHFDSVATQIGATLG